MSMLACSCTVELVFLASAQARLDLRLSSALVLSSTIELSRQSGFCQSGQHTGEGGKIPDFFIRLDP